MSYISTIRRGKTVLVWERGPQGRVIKEYTAPFYFFTKDPDGQYTSIFGDRLTKHEYPDFESHKNAVDTFKGEGKEVLESDVLPEQRILSDYYYNAEPPPINVTFLDIEVDYDKSTGFAGVDNPYAPINSVALYHQWQNKYVLLAVPPEGQRFTTRQLRDEMNVIDPLPEDVEIHIEICSDERELLGHILREINDSDILSGWNSEFFDLPYIAKRLENLGPRVVNNLSFHNAFPPRWASIEKLGKSNTKIVLSGRVMLDYLDLFRKYEMGDRPSYKLESIADEVLPDMPKLEYEGSLASLYQTNFPYFLRYNLRDTEILKGFEDRLGYVALANTMAHISTGTFDNVLGTIKLSELAICNYCWHELNRRVPDIARPESAGIQGALVLDPKVGMHEWVGSVDINSLYPSAIRSNNVSPETLIGQFQENGDVIQLMKDESDESITLEFDTPEKIGIEEKTISMPAKKWKHFLQEQTWTVSGYGTVFDQTTQGIIPTILENWYDTRKKYQKLKKEATDKLQAAYYDRLQYVYKIKLNSLYGALSNRYFRFFDTRMGESTTGTGRMVLQHQCCEVNKLLTGEYELYGDAIIYGDTDSSYFKTFAQSKEEAIQIADVVAAAVNKSYQPFMRDTFLCAPGYDNIIRCGREVVSDRGIFVDKKRYILHVIDSEGTPSDKLKVMGLDTKKTTLPKVISIELNKFIERLLKGESWDSVADSIVEYKDSLLQSEDVRVIGLPKGIGGLEDYTKKYNADKNHNLPGHVAAAICYNLCLDKFNDKESIRITSGMKIKVFYLTHTLFERFKSIALPTDIEVIPEWFYTTCKIDKDKHIARLVDNPIRNIIKAINRIPPNKQERMFNDLVSGSVSFEAKKIKRSKKEETSSEKQNEIITSVFGVDAKTKETNITAREKKQALLLEVKHKKQEEEQNKLADDIFGF